MDRRTFLRGVGAVTGAAALPFPAAAAALAEADSVAVIDASVAFINGKVFHFAGFNYIFSPGEWEFEVVLPKEDDNGEEGWQGRRSQGR